MTVIPVQVLYLLFAVGLWLIYDLSQVTAEIIIEKVSK